MRVKYLITIFILIALLTGFVDAAGLTKTTTIDGSYTIDKYNCTDPTISGTDTWVTPLGGSSVQYLVVAGAGGGGGVLGGGAGGGGGAAGGYKTATGFAVSGSLNVGVGAGGAGGGTDGAHGTAGSNSLFSSITSTGGGYGGGNAVANYNGGDGGSGGGSAYIGTHGHGTGGEGYDGGFGNSASLYGGGGGGGSSAIGSNGTTVVGGAGGAGTSSSISGGAVTYATGGYGGINTGGEASDGAPGTNDLGNGGNGGNAGNLLKAGGRGGSGVVYIKYPTPILIVASFTPSGATTGDIAKSVTFTDTSTQSPTAWVWGAKNYTPGNNTWFTFSTSQNLTQVFTTGNWSVNLTASKTGDSNLSTQTTWINVSPILAAFSGTPTSGNLPQLVTFSGSSNSPTTGSTYYWEFGDGNTSTSQNPTNTYVGAGNYTVNFKVTNTSGAFYDWENKTNYIKFEPRPAFSQSVSSGVTPLTVTFTDSSSNANSPTNFNFSFGDGQWYNTSNVALKSPGAHTYTTTGNFTTISYLTNAGGSNSTSSRVDTFGNLTISPTPVTLNGYLTYRNGTIYITNVTSAKYIIFNATYTTTDVKVDNAYINNSNINTLVAIINNASATGYANINLTNTSGGYSTTTPVSITNILFKNVNQSAYHSALTFTTPKYYNNATAKWIDLYAAPSSFEPLINTTVYIRELSSGALLLGSTLVIENHTTFYPNVTSTTGIFTNISTFSEEIILTAGATGYASYTYIFTPTSYSTITLYLTKTDAKLNTWYSPHQVQFIVVDSYGNARNGISVNATANSSSFPPGNDWLVTMYGISSATANEMLNGTLIMGGYTGTDGAIEFTMHASISYDINIINPKTGLPFTIFEFPHNNEYYITIPSAGAATNMTLASNYITYSLYNTTIDSTHEYFNATYRDTSGGTSSLTFNVTNTSGVILYTTTVSGFGVAPVVLTSGSVAHTSGETYTYRISAVQSQIGHVNQTNTLTWANLKTLGNQPAWVGQWFGIGLLIVFAGAFALLSVKYAMVIIPVITYFMTVYLQWFEPTVGVSLFVTSLSVILIIGVLRYMRDQRRKI